MNQAFNNNKIAHFCYLAMPHRYTEKELVTAAELGIGLLEIGRGNRVRMIARSRRFQPSPALLREFLRKNLAIAQCSICQNFTSREGGSYRKDVFSIKSKWVYFCLQCRRDFENIFTKRRFRNMLKRVERMEEKQRQLRNQLRNYRKLARKRRRVRH